MFLGVILGFIAASMHVTAFTIHAWQTSKGVSTPNPATWGLWTFISALNCASFITMREHRIVGLLPIVSSISCIVVFLIYLFRHKFSGLDFLENIALVLGVLAIFVWWHYHSATYANLVLQPAIVISFVPTLRGVWKKPAVEKALPWFIWSPAYIFLMAGIFLKWEAKSLQLVYPINSLILHALVGILSLRKPKGGF